MQVVKLSPLLAVVAVFAAFFAAPSVASAVVWTEEGEPITQSKTIDLSGLAYATYITGNGVACTVDSKATLYPGDEGEITSFDFDPETCSSFGTFTGCVLESGEAVGPWPIQATSEGIVVEDFAITVDYAESEECAYSGYTVKTQATGTMAGSIDSSTAMSEFYLEGEVEVSPFLATTEYNTGWLDVSPSEVYGIEEGELPEAHWIQQVGPINFSGSIGFSNFLGSVSCDTTVDATLDIGSTGSLTDLQVDEETCVGTGAMEGCDVMQAEALNLPGDVAAVEETIELQDVEIAYEFDSECELSELSSELTIDFESLVLIPDDAEAVSSVTVSETPEGIAHILGYEISTVATGELDVGQPETFGIGSNGDWTPGGALESAVETSFTGSLEFGTFLAGASCDVTADLTLEPTNSGSLTDLDIDPESCVGSAYVEGCNFTSVEALNLPGTVTATLAAVELGGVEIEYEVELDPESGCEVAGFVVEFDKLKLIPDDIGAIGAATPGGNGIMHIFGLELATGVEGGVSFASPGVFGISS